MIKKTLITIGICLSCSGLIFATDINKVNSTKGYNVKEKGAVVIRRGVVPVPVMREKAVVVVPRSVVRPPVVITPRAAVRAPVVIVPKRRW